MNVRSPENSGQLTVQSMSRSVGVRAGLLMLLALSGCAAFHPLNGIPAAFVPEEYLGPSRSGKKTIDLSLLVQRPPDQYRLAAGDILSVYVPGVLGSLQVAPVGAIGETPPINLPQSPDDPPTIGYPTAIRDDGTVSLPLVPPINLHGMTLSEAEDTVRHAYTVHANILNDERDRVLISLARRREYRVLVVRQETSNALSAGAQPGTLNIGNSKKGTAKVVRLPAYENDVLHALAKAEGGSDGLPGLDAKNTIYIVRRKRFDGGAGLQPAPAVAVPQEESYVSPPAAPWVTSPPITEPSFVTPESYPLNPPTPSASANVLAPAPPVIDSRAFPTDSTSLRAAPALERDAAAAPHSDSQRVVPPQNVAPQSGDKPVRSAPDVPIWPRPAEPAESLRRTSASGPPVWGHTSQPVVRGQSPGPPLPGHSGFAQPMTSPYGHVAGGMATSTQIPRSYGMELGGHDRSWQGYLTDIDPTIDNPNVTKIPIRLAKGDRPIFTERDIILQDGDIIFIESRETEVFYTSGLLGGGQYTLPRDYDLGVLEAVSIAQSPQNRQNQTSKAIGGMSALNMDVTFSASHVVILRQLVNGTRMPIEVDLYKVLRHPETENILIQPGDMVILQYTKVEAIAAFIERHLLEGALFGLAASQFSNNGGGGGGF